MSQAMTIAIIDDNPVNVLLLEKLVAREEAYHSVSFTDSLEGLAWCLANEVDLLLVDYMMPELDGISFIQKIRQQDNKKDIPIVMITADDSKDVRHQALEEGANDFLTKPINRIEFLARTRNMMALRKSQKKLESKADWLASEVKKATIELVRREREAIVLLSRAAEFRDPETGEHISRMSHYSRLIAKNLHLSEEKQKLLLEAAPMHDIGKVGTPDAILLKPAKLDTDEFAMMKQHAAYGYEILQGSNSNLLQTAAEIALTHHEKFDGSGYPHGLSGEHIPLFARIVAVADVFDALTSVRPYKKAWSIEDAVAFLQEQSGKHFDPACVDAFLKNMDDILTIKGKFQE
ncbi:MAG: response regulator [Ghiorsea sp.]